MRIDPVVDLLLGRLHLQEADDPPPEEDEEAEGEEGEEEGDGEDHVAEVMPDRSTDSPDPVEEMPLTEEKEVEVLTDGAIPQDSSGVEAGNFDDLNKQGNLDIQFEDGNFDSIVDLPTLVADKVNLVAKTLEPLIEKALIELLGSSTMYRRTIANIQTAPAQDGSISMTGTFAYQVSLWIGSDVDPEDIKHDANYVMSTLQPITDKVKISECAIDVADGTLVVSFTA